MQALGGAKNHMVVLPDADLDLAADAAVNAGFGSAGERCMAISVLVAVDPIADELVAKITRARSADLKVGDGAGDPIWARWSPAHTATRWPPTSTPASPTAPSWLSTAAGTERRRRRPDGFWLGPTLFDHVTPGMSVYTDEIFGPVLSVVRVASYDEALELINANPYGNGTAIFTNDGGAARRFQNEVEVGMVGINVPIPVPVAYYSLRRLEGLAVRRHPRLRHGRRAVLHPGQGRHQRWLDPSHGGINLGFPTNS